jgi:Cytochrome c3
MTGTRWIARRSPKLALAAATLGIGLFPMLWDNHYAAIQESTCVDCHSRADGIAKEVVALSRASSHATIGCQGCHAGDATSDDEARAHAGNWVGKPDHAGVLKMCGSCHTGQLAQFQSSKHAVEKKNIARPNCTSCHGVHTIGSPPESFTLSLYCAGCHGLEYLPALPAEFQAMLTLVDDLHDEGRRARTRTSGSAWSEETKALRRSLRTQVAAIVHPTDKQGGVDRIPGLIKKGEELKSLLKGQKRQ